MKEQVEKLDVEIKEETVADIQKSNNIFLIKTKENEYEARTVLIATGSKRRKLNIPDEEKYLGKGVSYCATCDAALYKNKIAAVLGGSDAAAQSALLAAEYASKVYIIYRKEKLRAEPIHIENISKNRKIEVICNANVAKIEGNGFVKGVVLDNDYKGSKKLRVDGIFIEIGSVPSTGLAKSLGVEMNPENEIIVDEKSRTNVEGVYAAGDVTQSVLKQAVTACAQGAIAAYSAYKLLRRD
jgi:thioredoxin reductase (NADPH)